MMLVLLVVLAGGVFCAWKLAVGGQRSADDEQPLMESHNRLLRSEIPAMATNSMRYRELFADNNDVQLKAAKKMGLKNPEAVKQPELCDDLVEVKSNSWYKVDTLYHSKPYLVPEASLLLTYISRRFDQLQDEEGVKTKVRPIVTSLLRNKSQVGRLRRVNRNATENSCHLYGTTFDLSYCRFVTNDGEEVMDNGKYKQLLALALYELRFEGLCYVKYERRPPCFHITVRAVDYEGELACETEEIEISVHGSRFTENGSRFTVNGERLAVHGQFRVDSADISDSWIFGDKELKEGKTTESRLVDSVDMSDSWVFGTTELKEERAEDLRNEAKVKKEYTRSKEFEHRSNYVFE